MLGIAVVILLGFLMYYHRLKKRETETKFKQSLYWAELGKNCFAGQPIFLIGFMHASLIETLLNGQLQTWMEHNNIFLFPFNFIETALYAFVHLGLDLMLPLIIFWCYCYFTVPLISASLTHGKLVKPLREEKPPCNKWFHLIRIFAVSPLIVTISLNLYNRLRSPPNISAGYMWLVFDLLPCFMIFPILIGGVIAIQMSRSRLSASS